MVKFEHPSPANEFLVVHASVLCDSYYYWTGKKLIPDDDLTEVERARALFYAPIGVVSHDTSPDPIFNYANRKALELFEMEWHEFTELPSRLSAEDVNRIERERLLNSVAEKGFVDGYSGIRISSSGRRFRISDAVIWNLIDGPGIPAGQAAMFAHWEYV